MTPSHARRRTIRKRFSIGGPVRQFVGAVASSPVITLNVLRSAVHWIYGHGSPISVALVSVQYVLLIILGTTLVLPISSLAYLVWVGALIGAILTAMCRL